MSKDLEKEFELVADKIIMSVELSNDEKGVEIKLEDLAEDFENEKSTKPAWMEILDPFLDTYDFNFFINNRQKYIDRVKDQDQKIADLEAKLEESEKKYNDTKELGVEQFYSFSEMLKSSQEEIDKLKQQLAEKEEELKEFKSIGATPRQLQRAYQERFKYNERRLQLEEQLTEIEKERDANYENYSICWKDNEYLKKQLAEKEKEIEILDKNNKLLRTVWDVDEQNKIRFAVEQLSLLKSQIIKKRRLYKGKFSEFSNGINDALCEVEEDIDNLVAELPHQHEDKGE